MNTEQGKKKKSLLGRILKWTGISLLVIILLLALLPILFKDKIVAIVKEQANKNLNAKVDFGDFDLGLIASFPDFRFSMDNLSIIGVNEFANDTLAFIKHLKTDINIKSVINGENYEINSIIIDEPRIMAKILPNGKANWDIAKADSSAPEVEDTSATKFSMSLEELKIKDAYIVYDDQEGKMYSRLEDLDYEMKGDFTQDVFDMKNVIEIARNTFIMEGIPYLSNVHTALKADLEMDMVKWKFTFKENEFSLNDLHLGLDGYILMPDTNIDMDLKFHTKETEFKGILSLIPAVYSKDFKSVKTSGKLNFDGWAKGRYNASQMPAFAANLGIVNASFKYPDLPKSVNNINVDIKVKNPTGVLDATTVDVNQFHIEMAGNPVDLAAHVRTPISDPGITASLKGMIDLNSVKDIMPLEKGDALSGIIKSDISIDGHMSTIEKKEYDKFKANGLLEIDKMDYKTSTLPYEVKLNSMKLNFTTQYVELPVFDAMLGKSDIKASGRIENLLQYMFKDELIKGSFAITSTLMDLNELMSSPSGTAAAPTETAAPTSTSGAVAVPANIDFVLDTKIARVLYTNLTLGNMTGNLVIRNQKVDMTNLSMMVIGGKLTLNGYYETTDIKKPTVAMNMRMDGFDIQETFKTFNTIQKIAPIGQYAKGTFTATVENFNTTMNAAMEPDLGSVNAKGIIKTKGVSVSGFPPFVKLGEALKMDQFKNMQAQDINANYRLTAGRLHLDPFDTKIAGIPTNITGSTGLDQTIDYKYKMEIPSKMLGGAASSAITGILNQANQKAGTSMALGEKINLAVNIGGTVTNPQIKTGLKEGTGGAVATVTTQAVNAAIDKAHEEAKKILEDAQREADKLKAENRVLAEKAKQEGYAQADRLVSEATNPIAKAAAKKAAEVAKKKTDEKVQKMIEEGDAKADKIVQDAKVRADAKAAESKK